MAIILALYHLLCGDVAVLEHFRTVDGVRQEELCLCSSQTLVQCVRKRFCRLLVE